MNEIVLRYFHLEIGTAVRTTCASESVTKIADAEFGLWIGTPQSAFNNLQSRPGPPAHAGGTDSAHEPERSDSFRQDDWKNKVPVLLLRVTIVATACLLSLAHFGHCAINHQIFPITACGTEAIRAFDHHGENFRRYSISPGQLFPHYDRPHRILCWLGRGHRRAAYVVYPDLSETVAAVLRIGFGSLSRWWRAEVDESVLDGKRAGNGVW